MLQRPENDNGEMTLLEHLRELRARLVWCTVSVGAAVVVASIVTEEVMRFLLAPAKEQAPQMELIFTSPMENVATFFKVALLIGSILAMPMLVYQALMFVLPALTPREKRWVLAMTGAIAISFVIGVAFSFYVILPPSADVLFNFNADLAGARIQVGSYYDFVARLLFWVGVTFEMPVFILALARFGLITGQQMLGWWRFAVVGSFVGSAIITPTIDPVTQTLVAAPMMALWLLGMLLAFLFGRSRSDGRGSAQ